MKGIIRDKFGPPETLTYVNDLAVPTPLQDQVVVKVCAAGVNPVDTFVGSGHFSSCPTLPFTPGWDAAGTVHEVGALVTKFKEGDRVYCGPKSETGTYAEYALFDQHNVFPLPENLSFQEGAALAIPYFTALRALLLKAGAKSGQTILVHGASGGVGMAACQIALGHGMRVFGTAGSKRGQEVVSKSMRTGRDNQQRVFKVFDHNKPTHMKEIKQATDGHGVDVILEMNAKKNLEADLKVMARYGTVVIIGGGGTAELTSSLLQGSESRIVGCALLTSTKEELAEMSSQLEKAADEEWLWPQIGRAYALENAASAQQEMMVQGQHCGKIVLDVQPGIV